MYDTIAFDSSVKRGDRFVPKMKTHKSTRKRFKVSGTGKLMRPKGSMNHLRRKKKPRTLRMATQYFEAPDGERKRVKSLLPGAGIK